MKKTNKVILYKIGRYQEDFEYLFPNIKVEKYITTSNLSFYNNKECISLKKLDKKLKCPIIICDRKDETTTKKFNDIGLRENVDFMYMEDFGVILDEKVPSKTLKTIADYKVNHKIDLDYNSLTNSEMLKKMIYTDVTHNLQCDFPFKHAQIQPDGTVYPCCPGRSEENIGNIFHEDPNKVWNSNRAKLFRLSIINKTYAFCNLNYCQLAETHENHDRDRMKEPKLSKVPEETIIAFDETCNLKCKSCRKCSINYNNDPVRGKINETISKKLLNSNWLKGTKHLVMATQGEVFFSKSYQKILFSKNLKKLESLSLHTNGILLTPETLEKLCNNFKNTKISLNVSVDSINADTYEKLRIGGNMKILKRNLENIAKVRKEKNIEWVCWVCVLQKDNYKELPELAKYAIALKANRLDVTRILNWGTFTDEEFKEISMYDEKGNPKPELLEVLNDPIFESNEIKFIGCVFKDKKGIN